MSVFWIHVEVAGLVRCVRILGRSFRFLSDFLLCFVPILQYTLYSPQPSSLFSPENVVTDCEKTNEAEKTTAYNRQVRVRDAEDGQVLAS